jgi:hypothetical protein
MSSYLTVSALSTMGAAKKQTVLIPIEIITVVITPITVTNEQEKPWS